MSVPAAVSRAAAHVPERLGELARIGATASGGVTRLPYTESEAAAVELFSRWARDAGARVVRDEFGNVFAIAGDWNASPGVMVGSHLDSVVNGGAYDGALGVVGGLAVLESWEGGAPICAAAFRAEETSQAGIGRIGSSVFAGVLPVADARRALGAPAADPLERLEIAEVAAPALFLELHVEQGDRLERAGELIGAVQGITGYTRWHATIEGRADHVGTAPMETRRDALAAAAEVVLEVERVGRERVDVATVGRLEVEPNRVGVVPAAVALTADLRCWNDDELDAAVADVERHVGERCRARGLRHASEVLDRTPTVRFEDRIVDAVETAASAAGASVRRMPSAANHDAGTLARMCPAGMVFVPSRGGRSHSPDEHTTAEACEAGTRVLALAAAILAG